MEKSAVIGTRAGQVARAVAIGVGENLAEQTARVWAGQQDSIHWEQTLGAAVSGGLLGHATVGVGRLKFVQASQSFARRTTVLGLGTGFAGAAGDAVTQLGAMAAGRQDGFDWTRSGTAFAGGALGGALGQAAYDKTCFRAGTPLVWEHGYRKVEEFQVGDRLAARSEFDPEGAIEWKAIEEVFVRRGLILKVTVAGQTIGTTAEHPFYLHGKGWTPAGELAVGDLLAASDGRWLPVERLYNTGALETVYNFRIVEHHTYFVGDQDWGFGVWAHNAYKIKNKVSGDRRERIEFKALKAANPSAAVQSQRYLRTADGKRAIDPLTGAGRRIDFAVIKDGRVLQLVETTSLTASKRVQEAKEQRIRAAGGTFIRDRVTRELLDISNIITTTSRRS